jgi:carboxymethylenebutenolidase
MTVSRADLGVMRAAVARPAGTGPFPVVVLFHGSHGWAREYVQLARALADSGVIAVAPCWFAGGGGAGSGFVTPIACPDAPPMPMASSPEAMRTIDALVQAARSLPGVKPGAVGLFGHSRGGGVVLNYVLGGARVGAAVLNSAGYPAELAAKAGSVGAPILILHGVGDSPAEGGGPMTAVAMARAFEAALRRAGRPVEAHYYEAGDHNSLFRSLTQRDDELARMIAFFRQHLRD